MTHRIATAMAAMSPQWATRPLIHNAHRTQQLSLLRTISRRNYTNGKPPNSPPITSTPPPKPLVYARRREPTQSAAAGPKRTPQNVVAYPYLRISVGILLCGSIIYSMVRGYLSPISFPQLSPSSLTHPRQPPASNTTTPPPSPSATGSKSENPA